MKSARGGGGRQDLSHHVKYRGDRAVGRWQQPLRPFPLSLPRGRAGSQEGTLERWCRDADFHLYPKPCYSHYCKLVSRRKLGGNNVLLPDILGSLLFLCYLLVVPNLSTPQLVLAGFRAPVPSSGHLCFLQPLFMPCPCLLLLGASEGCVLWSLSLGGSWTVLALDGVARDPVPASNRPCHCFHRLAEKHRNLLLRMFRFPPSL